jgi:hypothetical protein
MSPRCDYHANGNTLPVGTNPCATGNLNTCSAYADALRVFLPAAHVFYPQRMNTCATGILDTHRRPRRRLALHAQASLASRHVLSSSSSSSSSPSPKSQVTRIPHAAYDNGPVYIDESWREKRDT